jgi:glycine/D-amino acid oxidase-like deaminating enzyme
MLPEVEFQSFTVKPCIYARTPTLRPFIDHLGPRVVVAAGGNGRAAKSADAIGSLAARLALTGDWEDALPSSAFALPV